MPSREVFEKTLRYFLAPVVQYLDDDEVKEIMINGPHEIYIERGKGLHKVDARFKDDAELHAAVVNMAQYVGRHVRAEEPRFDARLPQGHRVHVVLPPLCRNGASITIRKHSASVFSLDEWVNRGSLTQDARDYLEWAIKMHFNLIVSGGTGTGKTTLLNSLTGLIPPGERILTIEDSAELKVQQEHVVTMESKPPDRKGRYAVTIRDLVHSSLRMRPDRIIIGECRGGEALDLVQAMNTGHAGSMSTLHSNSVHEALKRLETLALFAGIDIPLRFLRAQVAAAVHVVVQLQRLKGRRIVQAIAENHGLDDRDNYKIVEIFRYDTDSQALVATGAESGIEGHE